MTSAADDSSDSHLILMGTGTSVGVPVVGCRCSICNSDQPRNHRTRSGVLVRAPQGEFIIDTGPELRLQLLRSDATMIRAALFTHAHADHIKDSTICGSSDFVSKKNCSRMVDSRRNLLEKNSTKMVFEKI